MSSAESPVHANWKQAIVDCNVTLNIEPGTPGIGMRVDGNELGEAVFRGDVDPAGNPYAGPFLEAFEDGRLDKAMVGCGESASLIGSVKTVREIIDDTVSVFWHEIERLARCCTSPCTASWSSCVDAFGIPRSLLGPDAKHRIVHYKLRGRVAGWIVW